MKETNFRNWLENSTTMSKRPISDCISRCKRVERQLHIDLDNEYAIDRGNKLLSLLAFDAKNDLIIYSLGFISNSDIRSGLASLKSSVKKYFIFCDNQ